jgi:two-component system, NtrC family, sensor histidine kinase PilS
MGRLEQTMDTVDQRQWLAWLIRVRIVIITFLLGIELILQQVARLQNLTIVQVPMTYFLATLVFWYLLDLIYHILLKINADLMVQSYVQIFLDISMVSLVVYFTGGLDSYFYFLYPLTVLVGSIIVSRGGSYLVASLCFIQAGVFLELPFYNLIPFYGLMYPDLRELQLRIAANLVAFLAVAYLASKLAVILRKTGVELKDLQALNEDIIESLRSGLITTDLHGEILLSNSTAGEILEIPSPTLRGQPIGSLFKEATVPQLDNFSRSRREVTWRVRGGEKRYLGLSVFPLTRHSQTVGYVYNFQDLTEMKKLEREIQLRDRMAAVGRMAAAIAHEIRNPLASIAGSVKLFSGMAELDAEEEHLIQIVLKESERLNGIIDNFLQYSRDMKFEFEVSDVSVILEETLTLLQNHPKFDGRYRIEKTIPPDPVLASLDTDRMRQVFWNLGDNALKAMPQGGTLSVEIITEGERLEIVFRDTGTGMTPRQAEKIFEPFQSEFEGGTGLGLAIVYQIIQAHKGTIRAEPARHGCVFRIELPLIASGAGSDLPAARLRG